MVINAIYSKNGKDLAVRNGLVLQPGMMANIDGKWITIEKRKMIKIVKSWDNLSQSHDETITLIDF